VDLHQKPQVFSREFGIFKVIVRLVKYFKNYHKARLKEQFFLRITPKIATK